MKVLLISHTFPPDMGAASTRTSSIAKALSDKGHKVEVLAGRPYYPKGIVPKAYRWRFSVREGGTRRVWVPALETKNLWRRAVIYLGFTLSYSLALIRYQLLIDYDAIFYISPWSLSTFSLPALLFGRLKSTKVVLDVHDAWPEVFPIRNKAVVGLLNLMTKIAVWLADDITLAAESMGKGLEKTNLLPLAVDTDFFKPIPLSGEAHNPFVVGYSGILGKRYDFDLILKAAKLLKNRTEIAFRIRGVGEMEAHIRENLPPNVSLDTKLLSDKEVVEWLNDADILLCPLLPSIEAEKSSIPYKLVEYLAVGKPVICTDVGNAGSLIKESSSGLVVSCGNPTLLAGAILTLFYSPGARLQFGTKARSVAEERFSLPSLANQIEKMMGS